MSKILWADDQVSVARTLSMVLRPLSVDVDFVADGTEALKSITTQTYDLVLADLSMPPHPWGGLWLLGELSKKGVVVPVIVVSGEGSQTETIEAIRLGAKDYVIKERLKEDLLPRVRAALAGGGAFDGVDECRRIIGSGENDRAEFKSTLRWNIHSKRNDPAIELSVLKSIAGMLNANGGNLVIGVSDHGVVLGLDSDQFPNEDKLQLHFWNRVRDCIGSDCSRYIQARVIAIDGKKVLHVKCLPSPQPIYVHWKGAGESKPSELFFVRAGPQTESLEVSQAVRYIREHFGG